MKKILAAAVTAFFLLPGEIAAWDIEHDQIAALTGENLPVELKSFFTFEDFGIILKNCHYPDQRETDRQFWSLDEVGLVVGEEQKEILRAQGFTSGNWLHREKARALMMALISRSFANGDHANAAFWISALTHSVSDDSAPNHPPILNFLQYSRLPGVRVNLIPAEADTKNFFGFRDHSFVMNRSREKLKDYVPSVPAGASTFEQATICLVADAVRQTDRLAQLEGGIVFGQASDRIEAISDLVSMQVKAIIDMVWASWVFRSPSAALPGRDFGKECGRRLAELASKVDPFRQFVFSGIPSGPIPAGTHPVGLICEPLATRSTDCLSFVGRMLTASAGRTLADKGIAIHGISFNDLASKGLPSPKEVPVIILDMGSKGLPDKAAAVVVRYRDAGGKLILIGGADPKNISGFASYMELRADDEVPVSSKWSVQNTEVWQKMKIIMDGREYPLKRNPNFNGSCKPYAMYTIKDGAPVEPIAILDNGRARLTVAARRDNVIWIPAYMLLQFIFTDECEADWQALRLDAFGSSFLLSLPFLRP